MNLTHNKRRVMCTFRESQDHIRAAFRKGVEALGFEWHTDILRPAAEDVLLIWNRGPDNAGYAKRFDVVGARILVAENGYMGKKWLGTHWYALALWHHNGGGRHSVGAAPRWDSYGVTLAPWRKPGGETVLLAQRGIGEPGIASPGGWSETTARRLKARIRQHPGKSEGPLSLEADLANASRVVTWGSAAGIKAIIMGIPVYYGYPQWIGRTAAAHVDDWHMPPRTSDEARLDMLRNLAWAQWSHAEVEAGTPFKHLLF